MAEATVPATIAVKKKRFSFFTEFVIRLVKEKPFGLIGGIIVLVLLITGITADYLAPYGFNEIFIENRLY